MILPLRQSPAASGYALVLVTALLAILAVAATALVPDLVRQFMRDRSAGEARRLEALRLGLERHITRLHTIPAGANWIPAVSSATGLNTNQVAQALPEFPADANTRRVYLVHPLFTPAQGAGRLPYDQTDLGVASGTTNAPSDDSRVLIVSNVRRELTLPVGSGVPSQAAFEAIWDWRFDPNTLAPPAGWPSSWNGKADGLHVARLQTDHLFHTLTLKNLQYQIDGSAPAQTVTSEVRRKFLRGSLLTLRQSSGALYANLVVNKDAAYDLGGVLAGPLLYYRLETSGGVVATNSGSLGAAANGTFQNGPSLNQAGPRPPTFPGFSASNQAVEFDGNNDYVNTAQQLPSNLSAFTLAGWIMPTANMSPNKGLFGQRDNIYIDSKNINFLTLTLNGATLDASYPFANNTWHHVAATGDGLTLRFYLDGVEAASTPYATANHSNPSSSHPFRLAGQIYSANDYSKVLMDDVVFYDRALSAAEVAQLFGGTIPGWTE